jgi:hypothetical protein
MDAGRSKSVNAFPFISILVTLCRLLRLYVMRILNPDFLVSSKKSSIDILVKKENSEVRNERNIEDFK